MIAMLRSLDTWVITIGIGKQAADYSDPNGELIWHYASHAKTDLKYLFHAVRDSRPIIAIVQSGGGHV